MRLILSWPGDEYETKKILASLKEAGHEVLYWIELKKSQGKFPGIVVHDHFDAWVNTPPPEMKYEKFDPPSAELIERMKTAESIILTMMNKHFEGWSVDQRKNFYYDTLAYWHGVINKFKPEAVVFSILPHPVHNYLLFELARLLKIKTLVFDAVSLADRFIWFNDFWGGSGVLLKELEKNKDRNFTFDDLSEDMKTYLEFQFNDKNDPTPSYTKNDLRKKRLKNILAAKTKIIAKSIKDLTIFKKTLAYSKKLIFNNLQKDYRRLGVQPDLAEKFIYVPLHYQPECNTSPLGGVFVSQILMIKILSAALPPGWKIYVKEHPAQWIAFGLNYTDYRYPGYYEEISNIKNVRLVPLASDSFTLVKNSQAVATVTGTAGWEAILRQKPALVFGVAWYKDCAGAFRVDSVDSCRQALNKIASGFKPDRQSLINYLKSLEAATIRGQKEEWAENHLKKMTKEQYFDNILAVINRELKEFNKANYGDIQSR